MQLAFADFNETTINNTEFDCGIEDLNRFIKEEASVMIEKGLCSVKVLIDLESKQLLGYFSVAPASLETRRLPVSYIEKFNVPWPIPCWIIGKLAVSQQYQKLGLGEIILMGALENIVNKSRKGDGALIIVDAKDKKVKKFYKHYDFISLPNSSLRLILPIKYAKSILQ